MAISRKKKTRKPVRRNPEEKTRAQLIKEVEKLTSDIIEGLHDDNYSKYLIPRIIDQLSKIDDHIYEEVTSARESESRWQDQLRKDRYF